MKITIGFTGGGTAGHVFPGIAVLDSVERICREKGIETAFFWIGSSSGMEKRLIDQKGIKFYGIQTGKLRRYFSLKNFTDIFRIKMGIIKSFFILMRNKPDLIFSKGGYVSVPPVLAGRLLGINVVSHESDYTPGLATRINKRFSKLIMISFRETADFFEKKYSGKIFVSGNPVRDIFYNADPERGRKLARLDEKIPVIMVLGGSQGAMEINSLVEKLLPELLKDYYVIHQAGANKPGDDIVISESLIHRYKRYDFLGNEIADIISASDIVISRSGAGSIWELSALGKPSVIIPLRGKGTRGDQVMNAAFLREKGAAVVLDDDVISPDKLLGTVKRLFLDTERMKSIENAIKKLGYNKSADIIAEKILKIAGVPIE